MSVWELYTQLFARNWRCGRFARSLSQGCSEKIRKKDVVMTAGRWSSWSIQIPQFLMLWTCDECWIYCYDPETKRQSSQWKHAGSPRPKKARQSKSTHKLLMIPFFFFFWQHWHDLHALSSHWKDSQQGILCWGFKGVQEEIPSEEASTLQIGSVTFPPGQCISPQLHPCHRPFPYPPYSPELAPSDFWLFPKLRGCRYETIEEMKEVVTKVIDTLTQEDFHGAFQKLLERYNKYIASRGD